MKLFWALIMLAIAVLLCLPLPPAHAAAPASGVQVFAVRQQDTNNDGQPDVTIIDCAFATTQDQVRVYDRGGNMVASDDWRTATDFTDDVWVFDVGADKSAQLIIQFAVVNTNAVAYLYTDRDNNGSVLHSFQPDKGITVAETDYWLMRVTAQGAWQYPDGTYNQNLLFEIDGYLSGFVDRPYPLSFLRQLDLDHRPDFKTEIADQNRDGIPEYTISGLMAASNYAQYGFSRHGARVNVGKTRPLPPQGYMFWHLLGGDYPQGNYFDTPPFIQMDWMQAQIVAAGLIGYPIEQGYSINTIASWQPNTVNYVNFEAMMAYYDLAQNRDKIPELHIRLRHYGPHDIHGGNLPIPVNEVRWSWMQSSKDDLLWDYKIGLAGTNPITTSYRLGEYTLQNVPYLELPNWIRQQPWQYATFIADEGRSMRSSEGIYEWAAIEQQVSSNDAALTLSQYLAGEVDVPLQQIFDVPQQGYRGELATDFEEPPMLYFSPLDRKLHLRHANSGAWDLGNAAALYYDNLNSDAYLDQWIYVRQLATNDTPRTLVRQINVTPQHLIYSDSERAEVLIREVAVPPSLFEASPPASHAEWQQLGTQLAQHARDFDPAALDAMVAQFAGATTTLRGARLRDFRFTAAGYRYVIELAPDFRATGTLAARFAALPPGAYLIEHTPRMQISPLEPPALELTLHIAPHAATTQHLLPRAVELHNAGSDDASALLLRVDATSADETTTILSQTITVAGKATEWIAFDWQPPAAGIWDVVATLTDQQGQILATSSQRETAPARDAVTATEVLHLSTRSDRWWHSPLLLGLIGILIALSAALLIGTTARTTGSQP